MAMIGAPIDLEARWGSGQTFDFVGNVLGRRRRRREFENVLKYPPRKSQLQCCLCFFLSSANLFPRKKREYFRKWPKGNLGN